MKKRITAIFDSPDSADLALMRLRHSQIEVSEVHVRPLGSVEAPVQDNNPVMLTFPGLAYQAPSGPAVMRGYYQGVESSGLDITDTRSTEAILDLALEEADVRRGVEIMISSHGRRIRQWT